MSANIIAKVSATINAAPKEVWKALTTPELIRRYFFGTEAISDWKVGSELQFKGQWKGKEYIDKGIIQQVVPGQLVQFTYFSPMSGAEDLPENYSNITYELEEEEGGKTMLTVRQENIRDENQKKQAEENWRSVLSNLNKLFDGQSGL